MDSQPRILIIDDDAGACKTLELIFKENGFQADSAGSSQDALAKANGQDYNIALIDIRLPDCSGVDIIAPLKALQPEIAVIMITAFADLDAAIKALNEGASAFIHKPLNMDEVLTKIRDIIEKQRLIEENERMVEELRASEQRRRQFSEASFEAVVIHDRGFIHEANEQFFQMFGYDREELTGKQVSPLLIAPEYLDDILERIDAGEYGPYETVGLRKGNIRFPMEIRARETEYKGKRVRVTVLRDITERKRAEEALKDSEEKYRSFVQSAVVGIYRSNLEVRFTDVNPALVEML